MRLFDIARVGAFISCGALLSACPKKDSEAAPEPAAPAVAPTPASDKAGAEPAAPAAAAPAKKKDDDKGGW